MGQEITTSVTQVGFVTGFPNFSTIKYMNFKKKTIHYMKLENYTFDRNLKILNLSSLMTPMTARGGSACETNEKNTCSYHANCSH